MPALPTSCACFGRQTQPEDSVLRKTHTCLVRILDHPVKSWIKVHWIHRKTWNISHYSAGSEVLTSKFIRPRNYCITCTIKLLLSSHLTTSFSTADSVPKSVSSHLNREFQLEEIPNEGFKLITKSHRRKGKEEEGAVKNFLFQQVCQPWLCIWMGTVCES